MNSLWEFPFADSLLLVRPQPETFYILNPSAAFAWQLLRSGKTEPQAILDFQSHFSLPHEVAARDLRLTWRQWQGTILSSTEPAASSPVPPVLPSPSAFPSSSLDYKLRGRVIRVILHHPDLSAEIAPRLESLLTSPSPRPDVTLEVTASDEGFHIFSGSAYVATEGHPANARVIFLQEFARCTQSRQNWVAMLHAGACGTSERCVIFPAESHSGKTTLAAALMHSGLTFYGDDSIPLKADSFKVPVMPFALMIREGSWPAVSARFPDFANAPVHNRYGQNVRFLHPTCPSHDAEATPAAIVFSQWQSGVSTFITPLSSFEALVRLEASGFWVAHDPASIQAFLEWLQALPVYQMVYSDLDEATAFIRRLVGAQSQTSAHSA